MPELPESPYVRFWISNGTEVAMLTAADFRAAMRERDDYKAGSDEEARAGDEARAEVGRLRAQVMEAGREEAKLRTALLKIQQWDMLTQPSTHDDSWSDLPWLKHLVDEALGKYD